MKTATSSQENDDDPDTEATYSIRSSVLRGEVVSNVNETGGISVTYVRAAGTVVAVENVATNAIWTHKDPAMTSMKSTLSNGTVAGSVPGDFQHHELDPMGKSVGFTDPYAYGVPEPHGEMMQPFESFATLIDGQFTTLSVDGIQVPKGYFHEMTHFAFGGVFGVVEQQARLSSQVVDEDPDPRIDPIIIPKMPIEPTPGHSYYWRLNNWAANAVLNSMQDQNEQTPITTKPGLVDGKIFPRGLSEASCNFLLNRLFGNLTSIAASRHEPKELLDRGVNGGTRTHVFAGLNRATRPTDEFGRNIHVYGDPSGRRTDSAIYVPTNLDGTPPTYLKKYKVFTSGEYEERDNYPVSYSNRFLFSYKNGLTILVAHVAAVPDAEGARQGSLGSAFLRNGKLVGPRNMVGSFQIGYMGGPGGYSYGFYVHSHIAFWRNGVGVDPRREFCSAGGSRF